MYPVFTSWLIIDKCDTIKEQMFGWKTDISKAASNIVNIECDISYY